MNGGLDWWATELRKHMTVPEMLTRAPNDDWRVEFFDYVREELPPSASGLSVAEIRERRVPREPRHKHERALVVFNLNHALGMVQGKHFISGCGPDEQPNEFGRKINVNDIDTDKLCRLVEMAGVVIPALGFDLDTGDIAVWEDAYTKDIPPPPPSVAFDWGFLWIALGRIVWIRPPSGGRLRMSQLDSICDMLGMARVIASGSY